MQSEGWVLDLRESRARLKIAKYNQIVRKKYGSTSVGNGAPLKIEMEHAESPRGPMEARALQD